MTSKMPQDELQGILEAESEQFKRSFRWLEAHMPASLFEEVDLKSLILIARNLPSFALQNCYSQIQLKHMALVLSLDGPDADLRILEKFGLYAIRYYRAFVSHEPPPFYAGKSNLRIALILFAEAEAGEEEKLSSSRKREIAQLFHAQKKEMTIDDEALESLLRDLSPRFVRSLTDERLALALDMFFRAKTRDQCQYDVRKIKNWKEKETPSLQIVLAWRNVPKYHFLYQLAEIIYHYGLSMQKVVATYIDPYSTESILILVLGLHGQKGGAAWEEANLDDFLRELALLKYFDIDDVFEKTFVLSHLVTGNGAHFLRSLVSLVHQALVYADPNLYSFDNIQEGFLRHPELTAQLFSAFEAKFHPERHSLDTYTNLQKEFLKLIENLDTGHPTNDFRRKNILKTGLIFIDHMLKTNFYRKNKSAFSFRLDPKFLDALPFDRKEKFPELPFGIFFIRGLHFLGFNIRFEDLARGGVRTVCPERGEQYLLERNSIFSEAYNLALTQHKKNKDIPEGGSKTAILLEPFDTVFAKEEAIYRRELELAGQEPALIEEKVKRYRREQRLAFLYASQRSFIENFMTLINCEEDGQLRAKDVVDYWKRPEYIYLGPDENMHNIMIDWIAGYAVSCHYRPGRSFMSSKPSSGINHKEYGVTSYGVNVYMHEALLSLGIDPEKTPFTVKISGGPDGDVAGNQILNLYKYYPNNARLVALVDVSGTIYDPQGLDLKEMAHLYEMGLPIRNFPPEKLSDGGFLLDLRSKKEESAYVQLTLCHKKEKGQLIQEWLPGNEMNHLFRNNVHQVKADVFIPAGGRPRTLNDSNYQTFLDSEGHPTAKAIVEGANLYLTPVARHALEEKGVLIFKDSSCNKGGVICSSFEVLGSLCLSEEEFLKEKPQYVQEVLEIIRQAAFNEASLILKTRKKTGEQATDLSDKISAKINFFKYQILDALKALPTLSEPLIRCLLLYCPPSLREHYKERILAMPDLHKKAVIACMIAARSVYAQGLDWNPPVPQLIASIAEGKYIIN
jgi:glutamate dehydrogenase